MSATYPQSAAPEIDPVFEASGVSADELADAVDALTTSLAGKQDAATAATDSELADAIAGVGGAGPDEIWIPEPSDYETWAKDGDDLLDSGTYFEARRFGEVVHFQALIYQNDGNNGLPDGADYPGASFYLISGIPDTLYPAASTFFPAVMDDNGSGYFSPLEVWYDSDGSMYAYPMLAVSGAEDLSGIYVRLSATVLLNVEPV